VERDEKQRLASIPESVLAKRAAKLKAEIEAREEFRSKEASEFENALDAEEVGFFVHFHLHWCQDSIFLTYTP